MVTERRAWNDRDGAPRDATEITQSDVNSHKVNRISHTIGDPDTAAARARVTNEPFATDEYALAVRQSGAADIAIRELLSDILIEMKLLNSRFEEAFETNINRGDV